MSVGSHMNELARDLVKYGLVFALSQMTVLILLPVLTRVLSIDEYGTVDVIAIVVSLASVGIRVAMPSALARYWPQTPSTERPALLSTLLATTSVVGFVLIALGWPFLDRLSALLFETDGYAWILGLGLWTGFLQALSSIPDMLLRLQRRVFTASILQVVSAVVYVVVAVVLVLGHGRGVAGVFEAQVLAAGVVLMAALIFTRDDLTLHLSFRPWRRILRYSLPLAPAPLIGWFTDHVSRLLLLSLSGLTSVAIFAVADRVARLSVVGGRVFQSAWRPYSMLLIDSPERNDIYRILFNYYAAVTAVFGLLLTAIAPEILSLLAPPEYAGAYLALPWLAGGAVLRQSTTFTHLGSMLSERTAAVSLTQLLSASVNLSLGILLVRWLDVLGAALAFFIAGLVLTVTLGWLSSRVSDIRYDNGVLFSVLLVYCLTVLALVGAAGLPRGAGSILLRSLALVAGVGIIFGRVADRRTIPRLLKVASHLRHAPTRSEPDED